MVIATLASCKNNDANTSMGVKSTDSVQVTKVTFPKAGTTIANYEKKLSEGNNDNLNDLTFSVEIITTDSSAITGVFDVKFNFGHNVQQTQITFPKWEDGNIVTPKIQEDPSVKYGVIIGFDPGDGSFKDFYSLLIDNKDIKLKQVKAYFNG